MNGVTPEVGWQIVCFCLAASALWSSWRQANNGRHAQRRIVEFTEEFATKESVAELKTSLRDIGDEVRSNTAELHSRITEVAREVSLAAGETRVMNQNFAQLSLEVRNRRADK
jgi:hypothetical protein